MKLSSITFALLLSTASWGGESFAQSELYLKAHQAYTAKSYTEAYPLFEVLNEQFPESPEINFFLGRSALEMKRYDEAMAAFDRVLILNSQHSRTRLELARLYSETGQYEMAEAELETVLSTQLPSDIREVVVAFKANIGKRLSRFTFDGVLFMGGGYDSNANNDIGKKEFLVPSFNLTIEGNEKKSDTRLFAMGVFNFGYDFGDRGGWSIGNTLVAYTTNNFDESKNDLTLFSWSLIPTWAAQGVSVQFPLTYDRVYLDHRGYNSNFTSGISASTLIDPTSQIGGGYSYKRSYNEIDSGLDSASHGFSGSYKKAFGEDPIVVSLGGGYSINNELEGGRTDVTSSGYSYSAEITKTFSNRFSTSAVYSRGYTSYEEEDFLFNSRRRDIQTTYEVRIGQQIRDDIALNATASYTENSSNHAPFVYDKMTAQLSAALRF